MKDREHNSAKLPQSLSSLAVLGLKQPAGEGWEWLRGLQYACLPRIALARVLFHALAAAATVSVFWNIGNRYAIMAWLAVLGAAVFFNWRKDIGMRDADKRRVNKQEIENHARGALATAAAWVVPVAAFGPFAGVEAQLELWAIIVLLLTANAITLAAVPLGTVLFGLLVGTVAAAGFGYNGMWEMVVLTVVYVPLVTIGTIGSARSFLAARIAEAGVAEKSEVVSMLLREFEEGEGDWLWEIDTARRVRSVSPRFAYAMGRESKDIDGLPLVQLIAGSNWESGQFHSSLHDLAERLKRRNSFSDLLVKVTIDGEDRWWELSGTPKLDENGNFDGFRGVGSDVTEQRESSEKIAYMARYDTLTGLPNRMCLTEALGGALRFAAQWRTRCAFLMIDLDRFKAVNDTLGHLVGDKLLAMVSERLQELMSENETCGRLGGDEFAIVIRDASDLSHVNRIAQTVITRLSQPYEVDDHTLFVGASVGSAIGPRDGKTVETLMRNADLALYRSKDEGGGKHYTFEPSLHASAEERRQLEFALRSALEREELTLNFQPVVDANKENVLSFEALVRWNSAEHGFVSPGKFIPLAEDTRLIVPIGEWVLQEACIQAMTWPDDIRVAVNVSGEQLLDPNFSASVVNALAVSGLAPNRLEIEVTESIFVRDDSAARTTLEQCMALGCGVALDDFGTGYSSLGYLRKMRFSTIKVDRSFVQGAAVDNPESLAIIRAVVAMADSLDMTTTAEGVETEEELAMVRKLGCTKIQGFYYGRPMPAADARALFSNDRTPAQGAAA
ncbi:hypothetical protein GCM10010923_07590 [Blastomonas marina]|uniref:Diguanylate cyclase n=1 Tax=Blastomonas marina TaxID=1867408 RepID=A0ABQ1F7E8_9SPHN|nr:EAL domain-containing protein [Blastomonas marina]GGA01342.1 hypothetical protein GCM10010923_07590 [Blastomonas marina]